jgi:microcystin-dependent protein
MKTKDIIAMLLMLPVSLAAQNVGIDEPLPQQKLDVAGGVRIADATQPLAGSVRFSNGQFEFCTTDGVWTPLQLPVPTIPPGTIVAYGGTVAPDGWVMCDGAYYFHTNSLYTALHNVIGTSFGMLVLFGNPSPNSFRVPDLRGRFPRGVSGSSTHDPDKDSRTIPSGSSNVSNAVGSVQDDEFKSHTHPPGTGGYYFNQGSGGSYANGSQHVGIPSTTGARGGSETRPKNIYVNYIIKL